MTVTEIRPTTRHCGWPAAHACSPRWRPPTSTCSCVGRKANARYVSGAPRLWTAGSRPFGPGCVLVRATGSVHLLSTWDEGIPDDIPHENLYGITFNADELRQGAAGDRGCRRRLGRVATDAMTPSVGAAARRRRSRRPSSSTASRCCAGPAASRPPRRSTPSGRRSALPSARWPRRPRTLRRGVTERQLTGVFMEAMASPGVTTPAHQDVAWITSRQDPWRRASRDTPAGPGDLVAFDAGVMLGGYVGELGRTCPVDGDAAIDGRARPALRRAVATASSPRAGPAHRCATCSTPTKALGSRCRPCPWRAGSDSGSTSRS